MLGNIIENLLPSLLEEKEELILKKFIRRDFSLKNLLRNVVIVLIIYLIVFLLIDVNIIKLSKQSQKGLRLVFLFAIFCEAIIVSIYNWFRKNL